MLGEAGRRLRLATFNLETLDDRPGGPTVEERAAVLRPQLLRLKADVLCLQEVNGQHAVRARGLRADEPRSAPEPPPHAPRRLLALDRLLEGTPYAGFERVFTRGPDGVGAADVHNLVILSRLPIVESRQIRHDLVPPPAWRALTAAPRPAAAEPVAWDRPILHAAIDLGAAGRLHVVNLHLRAPLAAAIPGQKEGAFAWRSVAGWAEGYFLASVKRAGQALEVRLLVDQLFDARGSGSPPAPSAPHPVNARGAGSPPAPTAPNP
ncbi:MAG: endonuclease/exonuclease/phosphatase family protein, partial [Polyangiaceae bacterium]|nr:endonuclease/exonuclease/phosphatase family protein [Polyangiaceae bacterium]